MMDPILKKFTEILCGTLDNQQQINEERKAGQQIHPYAKHVTDICDQKIINRPPNHEGIYVLEESYYLYPGKEMELKPLLFYLRSDGTSKVLLNSMQIPHRLKKSEVTNANQQLIFDFNELKLRPFGTAVYTLQKGQYFTVDHTANMGGGLTFRLIERLSMEGLDVMELVHQNGKKVTPYDTPLLYRRIK